MIRDIKVSNIEKEIAEGSKIIYVSATWCGQCKMNKRSLEQISEERNIDILELDVDKNNLWIDDNNERFQIKSVPTFIGFKDGEEMFIERGFKTKSQLDEMINELN